VAIHRPAVSLRIVRRHRRIPAHLLVAHLVTHQPLQPLRRLCGLLRGEAGQGMQQPERETLGEVAHVFVAERIHVFHLGPQAGHIQQALRLPVGCGRAPRILHEPVAHLRRHGSHSALLHRIDGLAHGALHDGGEHLDVVFVIGHVTARGIGRQVGEGPANVPQRHGGPARYAAERKHGGNETYVGLHVAVKVLFSVGGRIYIEAVGNEYPGIDGKIVTAFALRHEAHFELHGELIVYLGLYVDHINGSIQKPFPRHRKCGGGTGTGLQSTPLSPSAPLRRPKGHPTSDSPPAV
jgi:hypothetical protein